ncbi:MAG: alpha/beta fold hydrolase [Chloroflexi bacterium]|nr:alpha/beta fold hydrolase [Chloroflexota bacterium]MDA1239689.1 alpha/beta fold hydrolase [Chloroflexota bacterium]
MKVGINDELALNYELDGDPAAQSVIVLTHGMGSSLRSWDADVPHLAKRHAVLRWDVRGHGDSDKPEIPYTPSMHASDLAGLLRALGIEKAHVGGNSMGGAITQRFVLDYPEMVRSAFLLCTSSQVGERLADAWERRALVAETEGTAEALRQADTYANYNIPVRGLPDEKAEFGRQQTLKIPGRVYASVVRAMATYHWTADLPKITAPVLILQGLQDTMTPPGGAVMMHRMIRGSQLVMMDECSHAITNDQPKQWRMHLLNFLDGVEHWEGLA